MYDINKLVYDEINSFLQYRTKGDEESINRGLSNLGVINGNLYISNVKFDIDVNDKDSVIGTALANIPLLFAGIKPKQLDLPGELPRIYNTAEKLISLNDKTLYDISTLEVYLLMEMGLRELYSKWVSTDVSLQYNGKIIKLSGMDYRKLKLYIRMNHMSVYSVKINDQQFPYSQGALLNWAERYMKKDYAEAFKISLNVRNLLAHGELEWELNPSIESLYTSSNMVHSILGKLG